jgi:ArsR family transcriptional regulator
MMESMVKCLRALGDENRLRILMLLRERDLCVLEVVGALEISQPLASSHLAVLREAGLATAHREGRRIRYCLSDEAKRGGKHRLLKQVAEAIAAEPLIEADRDRLAECAAFRGAAGACTKKTLARFAARGTGDGSPGDRAGRQSGTFKSTRSAS